MQEHIRIGREYPDIDLNTSYSFGLDDQEFVVAFETDDLGGLPRPRAAAAHDRVLGLHAARHAVVHLHLRRSVERALSALDGDALGHWRPSAHR